MAWELLREFERVRDALASRDETSQEFQRKAVGLRSVFSLRDQRTKWETKGAHYLRSRKGLHAASVRASADFDKVAAQLIEVSAPALAQAFDEELSGVAATAWREWPKQSGYSRSLIRVQVAQLAPTTFLGSVQSAAPYTTFIKGNPARVLIMLHGRLAADRIAKSTGAGIVARFNRSA